MTCNVKYERLNPTTACGEALKITLFYSSFDGAEIDKLEEQCKKEIGYLLTIPDCGDEYEEEKD